MSEVPPIEITGANPSLIMARWAYDGDGMPDGDTHGTIVEFEDAVFASMEQGGWGIEAISLTGEGTKEWRFYTGDVSHFMAQFTNALAGHSPYPLDFQSFEDPDWSALQEFHEN